MHIFLNHLSILSTGLLKVMVGPEEVLRSQFERERYQNSFEDYLTFLISYVLLVWIQEVNRLGDRHHHW